MSYTLKIADAIYNFELEMSIQRQDAKEAYEEDIDI
jgi:hypothetical protein